MADSSPTPPVPPQACVEAAARAHGYKPLTDGLIGSGLEQMMAEDRARSMLAAALAVRDDQGVPELVKLWLEQVGFVAASMTHKSPLSERIVYEDAASWRVPVFRLRGDTEHE